MKKVLVPLTDGFEEIEAVTIIDVLRRADWTVTAVSMKDDTVSGSRGVSVQSDCNWSQVCPADYDMMVLPGGIDGARSLASDDRILDQLSRFVEAGKIVGAICAAPLVLQAAGIMKGKKATCHPSLAQQLHEPEWVDERVVVDNNVVTSQGPGTTIEFALTLIRMAGENNTADTIADALILSRT